MARGVDRQWRKSACTSNTAVHHGVTVGLISIRCLTTGKNTHCIVPLIQVCTLAIQAIAYQDKQALGSACNTLLNANCMHACMHTTNSGVQHACTQYYDKLSLCEQVKVVTYAEVICVCDSCRCTALLMHIYTSIIPSGSRCTAMHGCAS